MRDSDGPDLGACGFIFFKFSRVSASRASERGMKSRSLLRLRLNLSIKFVRKRLKIKYRLLEVFLKFNTVNASEQEVAHVILGTSYGKFKRMSNVNDFLCF